MKTLYKDFTLFGGVVGVFFGDFVLHTAQNTLGKMCSGETETETETGTTAANNCRKRTQRAGRPEIRDSPNIAIGFCSRSHSDSDSPSLALCRTSALSITLSLRTERGLFERPLALPTHSVLVVVVVVPASTVGSLSLR